MIVNEEEKVKKNDVKKIMGWKSIRWRKRRRKTIRGGGSRRPR